MKTFSTYELVRKIIGPIEAVGETHTDTKRFENLVQMTELVDRLLSDIDSEARNNADRQEASMKASGQYAAKFMRDVREPT